MKTAFDPRHVKRENTIKALFAQSFHEQPIRDPKAKEILLHLPGVDEAIVRMAPEFPIDKINRADLAILRLAVYELTIDPQKEPQKVVIDEAIELAKEYGGEHSPGFINGALGKLLHDIGETKEQSV